MDGERLALARANSNKELLMTFYEAKDQFHYDLLSDWDHGERWINELCRLGAAFPDEQVLATILVVIAEFGHEIQRPFYQEWDDAQLLELLQDARKNIERLGTQPAGSPIVAVPPEHRVADRARNSLKGAPNVYQRGNALVRIGESETHADGLERPPASPRCEPIRTAGIQKLLSEQGMWVKPKAKGGLQRCTVPAWAVAMVEDEPNYPVPRLTGIVESPILKPDGTILTRKGLDSVTGLYLTRDFTLPHLTVAEAKELINYIVVDFPFAKPIHKAAWIAGLLTPFARNAFYGCTPFFLASANVAGCGKTLLIDLIAAIFTGRDIARTVISDDAEMRKRLTSLAMAGDPITLIDNLVGEIKCPVLDAFLTAMQWEDRILGLSKMVSVPILTVLYGSGNNVVTGGDLARRTVTARVQSNEERPEDRNNFKEKDILAFVRANRLRLISACLTILTNREQITGLASGSFQRWSDIVRCAVISAGWEDPWLTQVEEQSSDPAKELLRQLMAGWREADPEGKGLTTSEACHLQLQFPGLRAAIDSLPPSKDENKTLGYTLRSYRSRVVAGHKFEQLGKRNNTTLWGVVPAA